MRQTHTIHNRQLWTNRCEFQFQFVSHTSSSLKREADRRLQRATFNAEHVFLQVGGYATSRLSVFDKGGVSRDTLSVFVFMRSLKNTDKSKYLIDN